MSDRRILLGTPLPPPLPGLDLDELQDLSQQALAPCLAAATKEGTALSLLQEIEVAVVDDLIIARVHQEFLEDPSPTDVITFDHGEIVVSIETAEREAAERDLPLREELLRYIVHGLLHLAGHEDAKPEEREAMMKNQERIVELLLS